MSVILREFDSIIKLIINFQKTIKWATQWVLCLINLPQTIIRVSFGSSQIQLIHWYWLPTHWWLSWLSLLDHQEIHPLLGQIITPQYHCPNLKKDKNEIHWYCFVLHSKWSDPWERKRCSMHPQCTGLDKMPSQIWVGRGERDTRSTWRTTMKRPVPHISPEIHMHGLLCLVGSTSSLSALR